MTAPINKPTMPDSRNPPIAPKKITTMGVSTPRLKSMGLRIVSIKVTGIHQINNATAVTVSAL